jgi:hypothetical protein
MAPSPAIGEPQVGVANIAHLATSFLRALLNVDQETPLYLHATLLTEGATLATFVTGLVLVIGTRARAFFLVVLLRCH